MAAKLRNKWLRLGTILIIEIFIFTQFSTYYSYSDMKVFSNKNINNIFSYRDYSCRRVRGGTSSAILPEVNIAEIDRLNKLPAQAFQQKISKRISVPYFGQTIPMDLEYNISFDPSSKTFSYKLSRDKGTYAQADADLKYTSDGFYIDLKNADGNRFTWNLNLRTKQNSLSMNGKDADISYDALNNFGVFSARDPQGRLIAGDIKTIGNEEDGRFSVEINLSGDLKIKSRYVIQKTSETDIYKIEVYQNGEYVGYVLHRGIPAPEELMQGLSPELLTYYRLEGYEEGLYERDLLQDLIIYNEKGEIDLSLFMPQGVTEPAFSNNLTDWIKHPKEAAEKFLRRIRNEPRSGKLAKLLGGALTAGSASSQLPTASYIQNFSLMAAQVAILYPMLRDLSKWTIKAFNTPAIDYEALRIKAEQSPDGRKVLQNGFSPQGFDKKMHAFYPILNEDQAEFRRTLVTNIEATLYNGTRAENLVYDISSGTDYRTPEGRAMIIEELKTIVAAKDKYKDRLGGLVWSHRVQEQRVGWKWGKGHDWMLMLLFGSDIARYPLIYTDAAKDGQYARNPNVPLYGGEKGWVDFVDNYVRPKANEIGLTQEQVNMLRDYGFLETKPNLVPRRPPKSKEELMDRFMALFDGGDYPGIGEFQKLAAEFYTLMYDPAYANHPARDKAILVPLMEVGNPSANWLTKALAHLRSQSQFKLIADLSEGLAQYMGKGIADIVRFVERAMGINVDEVLRMANSGATDAQIRNYIRGTAKPAVPPGQKNHDYLESMAAEAWVAWDVTWFDSAMTDISKLLDQMSSRFMEGDITAEEIWKMERAFQSAVIGGIPETDEDQIDGAKQEIRDNIIQFTRSAQILGGFLGLKQLAGQLKYLTTSADPQAALIVPAIIGSMLVGGALALGPAAYEYKRTHLGKPPAKALQLQPNENINEISDYFQIVAQDAFNPSLPTRDSITQKGWIITKLIPTQIANTLGTLGASSGTIMGGLAMQVMMKYGPIRSVLKEMKQLGTEFIMRQLEQPDKSKYEIYAEIARDPEWIPIVKKILKIRDLLKYKGKTITTVTAEHVEDAVVMSWQGPKRTLFYRLLNTGSGVGWITAMYYLGGLSWWSVLSMASIGLPHAWVGAIDSWQEIKAKLGIK